MEWAGNNINSFTVGPMNINSFTVGRELRTIQRPHFRESLNKSASQTLQKRNGLKARVKEFRNRSQVQARDNRAKRFGEEGKD